MQQRSSFVRLLLWQLMTGFLKTAIHRSNVFLPTWDISVALALVLEILSAPYRAQTETGLYCTHTRILEYEITLFIVPVFKFPFCDHCLYF